MSKNVALSTPGPSARQRSGLGSPRGYGQHGAADAADESKQCLREQRHGVHSCTSHHIWFSTQTAGDPNSPTRAWLMLCGAPCHRWTSTFPILWAAPSMCRRRTSTKRGSPRMRQSLGPLLKRLWGSCMRALPQAAQRPAYPQKLQVRQCCRRPCFA